jgi:hypothetical protein
MDCLFLPKDGWPMRINNGFLNSVYSKNIQLPTSDRSRPDIGSDIPPTPSVDEPGANNSDSVPENSSDDNRNAGSVEKKSNSDESSQNPIGNSEIWQERIASGMDGVSQEENNEPVDTSESEQEKSPAGSAESPDGLSDEKRQELQELRRVDSEVHRHEQAHVAAGGQHVRGGPKYEYSYGPDGKRYAVGGSVDIDSSKESEPEDTEKKMRQVKAAAMAPANPSPADYRVAQQAARKESEARMEKAEEEREENQGNGGEATEGNTVDKKNGSNNFEDKQDSEGISIGNSEEKQGNNSPSPAAGIDLSGSITGSREEKSAVIAETFTGMAGNPLEVGSFNMIA